jgi:hypothetical protein
VDSNIHKVSILVSKRRNCLMCTKTMKKLSVPLLTNTCAGDILISKAVSIFLKGNKSKVNIFFGKSSKAVSNIFFRLFRKRFRKEGK